MTKKKDSFPFAFISRYFIQGLLVLLPLSITIVTLAWLSNFFIKQLGPRTVIGSFLTNMGVRIAGDSLLAYFIGWIIVLGSVLLLGIIVDIGAKKYIKTTIDTVMQNIPIINKLYNVSVRIVGMIDNKEHQDLKGMQVVYCFFGGDKGAAFLALLPTPQLFTVRNVQYHVILIPSAPVPVGGSMMLVPADSVEPAEMSIEEFTQTYLSMGAASPDILPKTTTN